MSEFHDIDMVILSKEQAAIIFVAACALGSFLDGLNENTMEFLTVLSVLGGLSKLSDTLSQIEKDFSIDAFLGDVEERLYNMRFPLGEVDE